MPGCAPVYPAFRDHARRVDLARERAHCYGAGEVVHRTVALPQERLAVHGFIAAADEVSHDLALRIDPFGLRVPRTGADRARMDERSERAVRLAGVADVRLFGFDASTIATREARQAGHLAAVVDPAHRRRRPLPAGSHPQIRRSRRGTSVWHRPPSRRDSQRARDRRRRTPLSWLPPPQGRDCCRRRPSHARIRAPTHPSRCTRRRRCPSR